MEPKLAVELLIGSIVVLVPLTATLIFQKKWLFIFSMLAIVTVLGFFLLRPYVISYQVKSDKAYLENYLHQEYPEVDFTVAPNKRGAGYNHLNPRHLLVVYSDEQECEYTYAVIKRKTVKLAGYTCIPHKDLEKLMYYPKE